MERIRSKAIVVCDAGPMIHLDEVGCLHLMTDFAKVFIPNGVRDEVLKHRQIFFESPDVAWSVVPAIFPLEKPVLTICKIIFSHSPCPLSMVSPV